MKYLLALLLVFVWSGAFAQNKPTLRELLFQNIEPCYSYLEESLEDENESIFDDENNIDDTRNGYLKVSGSYPTCGCECLSEVGAFRQSNGAYTLLINEEFSCSSKAVFRSNRNLKDILPENFIAQNFSFDSFESSFALFKLNVQIPRAGTDTKVSVEIIPFGINHPSDGVLTFGYQENTSSLAHIRGIQSIAKSIHNESTIDYLLSGRFDKINQVDMNIIQQEIKPNSTFKFRDIEELSKELNAIKDIYRIYKSLKSTEFVWGWDRAKGRFYVKEKTDFEYEGSFLKFLQTQKFWQGFAC